MMVDCNRMPLRMTPPAPLGTPAVTVNAFVCALPGLESCVQMRRGRQRGAQGVVKRPRGLDAGLASVSPGGGLKVVPASAPQHGNLPANLDSGSKVPALPATLTSWFRVPGLPATLTSWSRVQGCQL
eukprot:366195-Chlamydomonas_euryale.AAC.1